MTKFIITTKTFLLRSINYDISNYHILVFTSFKISNYFSVKDVTPYFLKSFLVCARCKSCYFGETCRHFIIRIDEHIKKDKKTHVFEPLLVHSLQFNIQIKRFKIFKRFEFCMSQQIIRNQRKEVRRSHFLS